MSNVVTVFERWLEWLDSHDGRLFRRKQGSEAPAGDETDLDMVCTIPNPPGSAIITVGDLRELVQAAKKGVV